MTNTTETALNAGINDFQYDHGQHGGMADFDAPGDMSKTIAFFEGIDADVEQIQTFIKRRADAVYFKIDGVWEARMAAGYQA